MRLVSKFSVISLSILCMASAGCASLQQDFQDRYCNENGGYERGMNDARADLPMNTGFARGCLADSQEATQTGYHSGYSAGLASRASETPGTEINLNLGGAGGNPHSDYPHYCEIRAFTETFAAWGATELEAQVNAKNKCTARYNEMHCHDVTCRR